MSWQRLLIHFLIGGGIVSAVAFMGSRGKTFWASFAAAFPALTVVSFYVLFRQGGSDSVVAVAKGMLQVLPAWIAYMLCVIWIVPRAGFWPAIGTGMIVYIVGAMTINHFSK